MFGEKQKRINVSIQMPAVSLKSFIERVVKDDDFFSAALENPLGAMQECGVNVEASSVIPADFATFFGALAGLKEVIKKKNIKDLTFEGIFGRPAIIVGSVLMAETFKGFKTMFAKNAYTEKEKCFSFNKTFEEDVKRRLLSIKDLAKSQEIKIEMDFVLQSREESRVTVASDIQRREDISIHPHVHADQKKSFAGLEDLFRGPLIHPDDLAAIAARIETFVRIMEEGL